METIQVAVTIFCDNSGSIAVQKRGGKTRNGEGYAFWGGMVEEGESGPVAMQRELVEELGYIPDDLVYVGDYKYHINEGKYAGKEIIYHVYKANITDKLMETEVMEGEGVVEIKISDVAKKEFFQCDKDLIGTLVKEGKLS